MGSLQLYKFSEIISIKVNQNPGFQFPVFYLGFKAGMFREI